MNEQVVGEAKRREPVDHSNNANHASTAPAFFSCWDIHAYYGESYIVQGVTFNVHEGEILALLGRNGAGKTSTLRALARTGSPMVTQGEIWLDHKPLHRHQQRQKHQRRDGWINQRLTGIEIADPGQHRPQYRQYNDDPRQHRHQTDAEIGLFLFRPICLGMASQKKRQPHKIETGQGNQRKV